MKKMINQPVQIKLAILFIFCILISWFFYFPVHSAIVKKQYLLEQTPSTPLDGITVNSLKIGQSVPENFYSRGQRYEISEGLVTKLFYEAPHLLSEETGYANALWIYNNGQQLGPDYTSIREALGLQYCSMPAGKQYEVIYIDWESQLMFQLWHDEENTYAVLQTLDLDSFLELPYEIDYLLDGLAYPYYFTERILRGKLAPAPTYALLPVIWFLFISPFLLCFTAPKGRRKRFIPLFLLPGIIFIWHMGVFLLMAISKSGI